MEWIIRVNTKTGKITKVKASQEEMHWGGRLLISKVLLREVPPTADPLGRLNKLIIAPGLLGDTVVTTTGKFSVGGKSPLTHGVKESDVGGEAGKKIARLGIKAVVLRNSREGRNKGFDGHSESTHPSRVSRVKRETGFGDHSNSS
jgi:aldehyde:ferredoxin oxidoreductase